MKHLAVACVIFFGIFSAAEQTQLIEPVITKTPGQIVTAVWPNGNEAQLSVTRSDPVVAPIFLEVTENFCFPQIGQKLSLAVPARVDALGWIWAKHQNPEKIGEPLVTKTGGQMFPLVDFVLILNTLLVQYPDLRRGLVLDQIQFPTLNWLPVSSRGNDQSINIASWVADSMIYNPEIGATENRTSGIGVNIKLSPIKDKLFEFTAYERIVSYSKFAPLFGNVISWYLKNESRLCQVTFAPDNSQAQPVLSDLIQKIFTQPRYETYLWQSDSLSSLVNDRLFKDLGYYD